MFASTRQELIKEFKLKNNTQPNQIYLGALFPGDATLSGWGTVGYNEPSNSWLHEVDIEIFSDGNCGNMDVYMTPDMLCAGINIINF